ncbi:hypothetical protein AYI68_g451 [Smittium mucronatum]|uniref:DNA replication factor Cdt1 C-terminal domain-containing protein n=1 Tax=Smittium mucronatum TaxID=133383 RepID=A0A1R0H8B8_9FUNG|nr:hypothetical protein AYI68_g451 [Smittium mucronatum]
MSSLQAKSPAVTLKSFLRVSKSGTASEILGDNIKRKRSDESVSETKVLDSTPVEKQSPPLKRRLRATNTPTKLQSTPVRKSARASIQKTLEKQSTGLTLSTRSTKKKVETKIIPKSDFFKPRTTHSTPKRDLNDEPKLSEERENAISIESIRNSDMDSLRKKIRDSEKNLGSRVKDLLSKIKNNLGSEPKEPESVPICGPPETCFKVSPEQESQPKEESIPKTKAIRPDQELADKILETKEIKKQLNQVRVSHILETAKTQRLEMASSFEKPIIAAPEIPKFNPVRALEHVLSFSMAQNHGFVVFHRIKKSVENSSGHLRNLGEIAFFLPDGYTIDPVRVKIGESIVESVSIGMKSSNDGLDLIDPRNMERRRNKFRLELTNFAAETYKQLGIMPADGSLSTLKSLDNVFPELPITNPVIKGLISAGVQTNPSKAQPGKSSPIEPLVSKPEKEKPITRAKQLLARIREKQRQAELSKLATKSASVDKPQLNHRLVTVVDCLNFVFGIEGTNVLPLNIVLSKLHSSLDLDGEELNNLVVELSRIVPQWLTVESVAPLSVANRIESNGPNVGKRIVRITRSISVNQVKNILNSL